MKTYLRLAQIVSKSEPISKLAIHYLARRVSEVRVAREPRYRRCIAVDEVSYMLRNPMYTCGLL
jgi:hypothetical protein